MHKTAFFFFLLNLIFFQNVISAQPGQDQISIDDGGIMHWTKRQF
jgi:hypothetical protein